MAISIEKIIQAVKSIKGQDDGAMDNKIQKDSPIVESIDGVNESDVVEADVKPSEINSPIEKVDCGDISLELNDEEKTAILILESSGFFESESKIGTLEKIKVASEFVSDNLSEIFDRTRGSNSQNGCACPSCGAISFPGAAFCYHCGTKLDGTKKANIKYSTTKWLNKFFEVCKVPGFEMAISPITQEIWKQIMNQNPSYFKGDDYPVERISWYDAIYFCNKLSELCGYNPCYSLENIYDTNQWPYIPGKSKRMVGTIRCDFQSNGFRLPTVSEWLTAAFGRTDTIFSGSNNIDDVAWFKENSKDCTHPVCSKKPNAYGLYDMNGNVYEWCWDSSEDEKYYCGGSWKSREESCEINCIRSLAPSERLMLMGFRVVRSI